MFAFLKEIFDKFGMVIYNALPHSFIQPFVKNIKIDLGKNDWLRWLNWFVPVDKFILVLELWLSAIAIFYLYQVVARWVKVIGD